MRPHLPLFLLFALLPALLGLLPTARAQEINVEAEQFPGAKRVKVESFQGPGGYWAQYSLDARGRAAERRGYCRRQPLSVEQYTFTNRNQLRQEKVTDAGPSKRVQVFRFSHLYSPDSARIIGKVGLADADTMFVFHYLEFDPDNRPTKYTKAKGWSRKADEVTELTYSNGHLATYRRTDYGEAQATVYTVAYQYNSHGDLTKESRAISPPPPATYWLDGQADKVDYDYDYSPHGPWMRKYHLVKGRKVLVEKRTFTY